jgi:hypothetical protein
MPPATPSDGSWKADNSESLFVGLSVRSFARIGNSPRFAYASLSDRLRSIVQNKTPFSVPSFCPRLEMTGCGLFFDHTFEMEIIS